MKICRIILLLLFPLLVKAQRDTTFAYWQNGQIRSMDIFKTKKNERQIVKTIYFDRDGKKISDWKHKELSIAYDIEAMDERRARREDSFRLWRAAMMTIDTTHPHICLTDQVHRSVHFNISLSDTNGFHYVEKDTTINGHRYEWIAYDKDGRMVGTLRCADLVVYYYEAEKRQELELINTPKMIGYLADNWTLPAATLSNAFANTMQVRNGLSEVAQRIRGQLLFSLFKTLYLNYGR